MSAESSDAAYHRLRDESAERRRRRRRFVNAMWSSDEMDCAPADRRRQRFVDTFLASKELDKAIPTRTDFWRTLMELSEDQEREQAATVLADNWMLQNRGFMGEPEKYSEAVFSRIINEEAPKNELRVHDGSWIQTACSQATRYILRRREALNLEPQTAYLSVMYLTKYVSTVDLRENDFNRIRRVAVASLVLASYREEKEFPLWKFRLYPYFFTDLSIQKMAYEIVTKCNWEGQVTNPFRLIHFFVKALSNLELSPNLLPTTESLLLSAIRDVNIVCQRASIVTLAAIIHVVDADDEVANRFKTDVSALGLNDIDADLATVRQLIQRLPSTEKSAGCFDCLINCFGSD